MAEDKIKKTIIDTSKTLKPDMVAYRIVKEMDYLKIGETLEVIIKDNKGILADIKTFCDLTGHIFLGSEKKEENKQSLFIKKGEQKKNNNKMTVIISTARLEQVLLPFCKALAAAVLGMEVNIVFEGAGVRLLKKDYHSKLSGFSGILFTGLVKKILKNQIGWPVPEETIAILEDLGANFYICGPSMPGFGVKEEELAVKKYIIAAIITTTNLLANSNIHIFSKAEFSRS
ncbi:MAG: DsrE family protein [Candidatus Firestonebacteria bacterium]